MPDDLSDPGRGPRPDALSEVLQDLRLTGVSYGRCALTAPWGISLPDEGTARFHFVASGNCVLRTPDRDWITLRAGDAVLLPLGADHLLSDRPGSPTYPLADFPLMETGSRTYRMTGGGGGAQSLLFCCSVTFESLALHPLLSLMPPVLLVRDAATADTALPLLLEAMAAEVAAERVGAATVLTRLADVVIARMIRAWVEARCQDASGWLAAIRDPRIGRALAAIHRSPGQDWSVEALADIARSSRSTFSERFTDIVGVSPARYVANWRMHVAGVWLKTDRLTVAEVAARLGYESEASFSRAFKRLVGVPPGAVRRAAVPARPGP